MKVNQYEALLSIFILKVLIIPPSMVEAVCLTVLLAHQIISKHLKNKTINDELLEEFAKLQQETRQDIEHIKKESKQAIDSMDGIKTAINFIGGKNRLG
jgi:hypothetical protein